MVYLLLLIVSLSFTGCAPTSGGAPAAIRLVDDFEASLVDGKPAAPDVKPPRTEWRFDGDAHPATWEAGGAKDKAAAAALAAMRGWEAGPGIDGLAIRNGRLTATSTAEFPILHVERTPVHADQDLLYSVQVRMRASAGTNLQMAFAREEKVDLAQAVKDAGDFPWSTTTPIVAGDQMRTYVLRPRRPVSSDGTRHVLLRPTDAAGAHFEIESVRLVFRKEHLAGIPPGVGWQGLSEIYHETIVARSPESIRFPVRLPARPWLDLSIGTIEDGPVTFRVGLSRKGSAGGSGGGGSETALLERTITRPHRWESVPIDLGGFAGEKVALSLTLSSGKSGAIGFWGSPVVRSRGATPARAATERAVPGDPPQGVILIWADTLRRDHLGVYGYARETAPNLRRLAGEGALFEHCVVQATWTKVSTPSLLTSLYPTSHRVHDFSDRIAASATTLAEVYRDAGYATLSMSSILFTGAFTNLHQGFEEVHEDGSLPDQESSKTAREYVDRLLPWLETHRDAPFFVFLHVADPHDPYKPYAPYDTMWGDPSKAAEHERQMKEVRKVIADPLLRRFGMPTRDEIAKAGFDPDAYVAVDRDWYDGSIRGMDAEIARLVERLRTLGLEGKTVVAFTGDHGEEFHDHGRSFHGQSTYGELANSALILWGPGVIPPGAVIGESVQTIDLMPTLLSMSGLVPPKEAQGRSLVPLLAASGSRPGSSGQVVAGTGDAPPAGWEERPAISEKIPTPDGSGGPPPRDTSSKAITLGGWKLIHNIVRPEGKPEYELYDALKDPLNKNDQAGAHPEIVERLTAALASWQTGAESVRLKADTDAAKNMSQEELERLRSLGYIQ